MTVAHKTGRAHSGALGIFYRKLGRSQGSQLPVLIVHGLSYFSWDWLDAAGALGDEREAACMDMRGFGDSDWSAAHDYSVPAMAGDIGAVLDDLGWRETVLVGHSMGGRSSTFFAAKNAARVRGLVLVDFSPENAAAGSRRVAETVAAVPDVFASIEEATAHFGKGTRERFQHYLRDTGAGYALKRDPYFREQFRKLLATGERPKLGVDLWQVLAEVRCPVLSLRGSRSDLYAAETKPKMLAANPRVRITEVDAGHDVAGENLSGFLGALRPFLGSLKETP